MDGITAFALQVKPNVAPDADPTKGLLIRMHKYDYISLSSVAAKLGTSRGRLAGDLLHIALQQFVDTLKYDRPDLADKIDENGVHHWSFYSPKDAADLDELSQGTFSFHGTDLPPESEA